MYIQYSLHRITDNTRLPFSAADYSRFKFGDGQLAHQFGCALARAFTKQFETKLLNTPQIVYVPSPYDAIPTASYAMAAAFKDEVNAFLYRHHKGSLLSSKIHRYKTYTEDYGNLNFEERLNLISSDAYHIDKSFLEGRMVLFLDDIRITGSHEIIIKRLLEKEKISGDFFFLYYALLENPDIAPSFENYLNYYEVSDIHKIATLFQEPHFIMNTRVIKYILKSSSEDVQIILSEAPRQRLEELVAYAIGNNYHLMDDYKTNLNTIIKTTAYGHQSSERTAREFERA